MRTFTCVGGPLDGQEVEPRPIFGGDCPLPAVYPHLTFSIEGRGSVVYAPFPDELNPTEYRPVKIVVSFKEGER